MGPSKRSLPVEADEESDDNSIRNDTSRKRRRSQPSASPEREQTNLTYREEDPGDPEEFYKASQLLHDQMERPRENAPAPYGTILSVTVENFMCHKLLQVNLGAFMNFIVGQNGSGKSAVLTAITLCLGGKAAATNRGSNIKGFIKSGEHHASIEVKLRNGEGGYKTEIYGDVIIVQRSFNLDGGGGYKLKSKAGKVISNRKEELDDISDFMGLQIDNPMTLLSQDLAREFLNSSKPETKYKYFMKGVQLDQLYGDYRILENAHSNIAATLDAKARDIDEMHDEMKEAEKKFIAIRETENLREKVELFLRKHAWSQVAEAEKDLESRKNSVVQQEADLDKQKKYENELSSSFAQIDRDIQKAKEEEENAKRAVETVSEEKATFKEREFEPHKAAIKANQDNEREIHGNIRDAENKVKKIEHEIEDEHRKAGSGTGLLETQNAKLAEKEGLEQRLEDLTANHDTQRELLNESRVEVDQANEKWQSKSEEIRSAQNRVRELENSRNEALGAFNGNIRNLIKAIDIASWHSGKPVGPVGLHVKLLKEQWSSVLERVLSNSLGSFVVNSEEDKRQLQKLMRDTKCDAPISKFVDTHMNLNEPPADVLTVLRALEINNDQVMKMLVINHAIEQTVLIEDHNEAVQFMIHPPTNAKFCYALQQRPGWGFNVKGGQGMGGLTPIRPADGLPKMTVNIDSRVRASREEIEHLRRELEDFESRRNTIKAHFKELQKEVDEYSRKKLDYTRKIQRLDVELDGLATQIQDAAQDGKLAQLTTQLEIEKERHTHYQEQYEGCITEKDTLNEKGRDLAAQMNEITTRLNAARAAADEFQAACGDHATRRESILARMAQLRRNIDAMKAKIELDKVGCEQLETDVQAMTNQANQVGERIPLERGDTPKSLGNKLDALNKNLEEADRRVGGKPEDIAKAFRDKKTIYLNAEREMHTMRTLQKVIKETWEDRITRWYSFRRSISFRSRIQFHYYMSERDYNGQLKFNHENGHLILAVQPSQQAGDGKRETNTLSGGEKSFSQICLLLALWDAMGSPFRCLDEFDVFMDAANRGAAMDLIVKGASRSYGKQFILITPQDVSTKSIEGRSDVRIVRMRDPERNQGRLNFN